VVASTQGDGIGLMQQDRSGDAAAYGPHVVQNVYIHDNVIDLSAGPAGNGAVQDTGNRSIFTSLNNHFEHNTYYLGSNPDAFEWANSDGDVAFWQGQGQDLTGTFHRSALPADAILP